MAENNNLKPLFGVFFTSSHPVDEKEVLRDFSSYGRVMNVRQLQNKVFVNFISKASAEKLLQERQHKKYGEIKKGRFGPKDPKETNNGHLAESRIPSKTGYRYDNQSSNYSLQNDENFDDETKDCIQHPNDKKGSPKRVNLNSKISNKFPSEEQLCKSPDISPISNVRLSCKQISSSYNEDVENSFSSNEEPPKLKSVFHYPRPSLSKCDDGPPSLMTALSVRNDEHVCPKDPSSYQRPSLKACEYSDESKAYRSFMYSKGTKDSRFLNGSGIMAEEMQYNSDIRTSSRTSHSSSHRTALNDSYLTTTSYCNIQDSLNNYSNQILIANVPDDTTTAEIEKVLYPLQPLYISEIDVTNVRLRLLFVHVIFLSEDEASKAAKQFDGLKLRGYNLTVKRLDDLILLSRFALVT